MQGRTGSCRASHASSGFTFLWQSEWTSLAPVCATLSSTAACNIRPNFGRMGARGERPIKLSDTGWKFNVTSLFFRGAEHMRPFVSETTSTACFEGCQRSEEHTSELQSRQYLV